MECFLVQVFFKGFGGWLYSETKNKFDIDGEITPYEATGVFQLHSDAEIEYKHTGKLPKFPILVPSDHIDDEFKKTLEHETEKNSTNIQSDAPGYFHFYISRESHPYGNDLMRVLDSVEDVSHVEVNQGISETEREKLLKQIGAMALLLSKKNNTFSKSSGEPNISQIAEAIKIELHLMGDLNLKGLGESSLRASIKEGLGLLNK